MRRLLPLALIAVLAGPALAQDDPDGEPGVGADDPGTWTEPGDEIVPDDGDVVWLEIIDEEPVDVGEVGDDGIVDGDVPVSDDPGCDGCEAWTTGLEPEENLADGDGRAEPVGRVSEPRSSQIRQWCLDGVYGQYSTRCAWVFR